MNQCRLTIDNLSHRIRLVAWNLNMLRLEMREASTALAKFCSVAPVPPADKEVSCGDSKNGTE